MEAIIAQQLNDLPEPLRPAVSVWLERLHEQGIRLPESRVESVVRLVACSEFAAKVYVREIDWAMENLDLPSAAPDADELNEFVDSIVTSRGSSDEIKSRLRRFRNRRMLHILWREIHGEADLDETLAQLSLLADRLLDAATRFAENYLQPRFGRAINSQGDPVPIVILGMGKLGGSELNFSSDIDLIFCFPENCQTDGKKSISEQEYFTRLSRVIISLLDEPTVDGFAFRIDTRLRPFGDSGPPVVSFAALESYLMRHGRDWERYAYVKARIVGARPSDSIMTELYNDIIRPFVFRRYLDFGIFESVRDMQAMIASEVRRRDLADNVKLGPGGIREAEFIVQAMQLVRGGSEPALQSRELQVVLPRLVSDRGISASAATAIRDAYRFLRRVENFVQAIRDEQVHDIPGNELDRNRLCLAMNYNSWRQFTADLEHHRDAISEQFDAVAFRGQRDASEGEQKYERLWESRAGASSWEEHLEKLTGADAATLAREITAFAALPTTRQVDTVSSQRLKIFIPKLVEYAAKSDAPVSALTRTLTVVERVLRRSAYIALLNENQQALSRLVDLCSRSEYIASQIARYPVLLDELLDPRIYSESVTRDDLAEELRHRLNSEQTDDSEALMLLIAQFQRATMFRIAVADFNDKLPIMKVSDALTWLAEVVLDEALRVAWNDMTARYGCPTYKLGGITERAGFGIVGYGKLGGLELSYGSDLDIVFLHDSKGENQQTDGDKPLENSMFFGRLVRRLVHYLTTQTGSGELYEIDTRLRPDGKSGLLVTSTEAFERYQEENAWTWEHQALLRARPVAGSKAIAAEFDRIRGETLVERVRHDKLREDVSNMRRKMRSQLDRSDNKYFDLKQGPGGIGDIEFLVQFLTLREAKAHPDVIIYSDNIRQIDALMRSSILDGAVGEQLQDIYRRYRQQVHRLVLDGQKALCEADDFTEDRDVVVSLWREILGDGP